MSRTTDGFIVLEGLKTKDLIMCRSCKFSEIKDYTIGKGIVSKGCTICKEYNVTTNPEGYCWKAVRKDDYNGR